jgi:hypothetical protein
LASVLGLAVASGVLAASGLAIASGLASVLGLAIASGLAAGVDAAGVDAGGVGVSVAQETNPADKPRLATIKSAFKFIVVIVFV